MAYPAHASGYAYLVARIAEALPGTEVKSTESTDIGQWLDRSAFAGGSVLVSYDGYTFDRTRESKPVGRRKLYSVYWHGRDLGGEATMDALVDAIHGANTFTIDDDTHYAMVVGGRYLMLDRGFDSYQLEIEITT